MVKCVSSGYFHYGTCQILDDRIRELVNARLPQAILESWDMLLCQTANILRHVECVGLLGMARLSKTSAGTKMGCLSGL